MPATHHIDDQAKLIITTWEGEAVDMAFITALKKYQKSIQTQAEYREFNEVVDLRGMTKINLTTDAIKNLGQIAANTDRIGMDRKLAIIVNSDLAYGLVRMYEAYRKLAGNTSKEVHVFKEEQVAYAWVNSDR